MPEAWIIDAVRTPRASARSARGPGRPAPPDHRRRRAPGPGRAERPRHVRRGRHHLGTSRQVGTRVATSAAWPRSTPATTSIRAGDPGPLLRLRDHRREPGRRVGHGRLRGLHDRRRTELMSSYGTNKVEGGGFFIDSGNEHLGPVAPAQPGRGRDAIATLEGIPRRALDELAESSQARAATAIAEGRFDKSLIAVHDTEGNLLLDREEYPRPGTTATSWPSCSRASGDRRHRAERRRAHLPQDDRPEVPGSRDRARPPRRQLVGRGRRAAPCSSPVRVRAGPRPDAAGPIVAAANMGDDPTLMLNAPVPAARKVLARRA